MIVAMGLDISILVIQLPVFYSLHLICTLQFIGTSGSVTKALK